MNDLIRIVCNKKKLFWVICLVAISWLGCWFYPLNNYGLVLLLLSVPYGYIGIMFVGLIENNLLKVFSLSSVFNLFGMMGRYILEYDEVSNERNFTLVNIMISIIIIPTFITVIYWIYSKRTSYEKGEKVN